MRWHWNDKSVVNTTQHNTIQQIINPINWISHCKRFIIFYCCCSCVYSIYLYNIISLITIFFRLFKCIYRRTQLSPEPPRHGVISQNKILMQSSIQLKLLHKNFSLKNCIYSKLLDCDEHQAREDSLNMKKKKNIYNTFAHTFTQRIK